LGEGVFSDDASHSRPSTKSIGIVLTSRMGYCVSNITMNRLGIASHSPRTRTFQLINPKLGRPACPPRSPCFHHPSTNISNRPMRLVHSSAYLVILQWSHVLAFTEPCTADPGVHCSPPNTQTCCDDQTSYVYCDANQELGYTACQDIGTGLCKQTSSWAVSCNG